MHRRSGLITFMWSLSGGSTWSALITLQLLACLFVAKVVHELGHFVVAYAGGLRPHRIVVSLVEHSYVEMPPGTARAMSYATLGGPVANLCLAIGAYLVSIKVVRLFTPFRLLAGVSLSVVAANLLRLVRGDPTANDLGRFLEITGSRIAQLLLIVTTAVVGIGTAALLWSGAMRDARRRFGSRSAWWRGSAVLVALGLGGVVMGGLSFVRELIPRPGAPSESAIGEILLIVIPLGLALLAWRDRDSRRIVGITVFLAAVGFTMPRSGLHTGPTPNGTGLDDIVAEAERLDASGKYEEAVKAWTSASRRSPQVIFFLRLSEDYLQLGRSEDASVAAASAVQHAYSADTRRVALLQEAVVALERKEYARACAALRQQAQIGWRAGLEELQRRSVELSEEIEGCTIPSGE